jgi:nitroimidazol reductase NimA-like FMN-containing flavoprotein (pyridoxamine 5'-phosphate oxidase superfamily)
MKYHIRRKDRVMADDNAMRLLETGQYGVMSTVGADGMPYGVPLSYVVDGGHIFFHCARTGRKLDGIASKAHVAFTVVGEAHPYYSKNFTTSYQSVMVFGTAKEASDDEKRKALIMLCQKYLPSYTEFADENIKRSWDVTAVYKISIDELTAKEKVKK